MSNMFNYHIIYEILLKLRENFHSYGRIDDSNAKLDEIIKLICVNFSLAKRGYRFNLDYVKKKSKELYGNEECLAKTLRDIFRLESQMPMFYNNDNTNIFGADSVLNIQPTEDEFAKILINEIGKIDFLNLLKSKKYSDFDLVNECFGHFVRENFRNNKEDAQYMTPYEVVSPVLDIIFSDMIADNYLTREVLDDFLVMDPSCGVGTLLIECSNYFTKLIESQDIDEITREKIVSNFRTKGVIGQDKVDRMVRLSKINMLLLGGNMSNIFYGNSIVGTSKLSDYKNKVDLIFTNPPFGAEYQMHELVMEDYPILNELKISFNGISSELLMLDKCINLLKDGGYLGIILPDSVFSSKGINELYRTAILNSTEIRGIIELPDMTFAQAGTRAKTSILYLKKISNDRRKTIFMATCSDLGYIVKEKIGVPVKLCKGENSLPDIANKIINNKNNLEGVVSENPSITYVCKNHLIGNILKPSFYSADRFNTLESMKKIVERGYQLKKLSEVVDFVTHERKLSIVTPNVKYVSVLHINSDCTINFREVEKYNPISKGRLCKEGDLIFSKINPRIPRMAILPKIKHELVCSSEFEIMRPKNGIDIYTLCFLLRTKSVQLQIENLTSGTSSSHSRIKREQLENIIVPVPTDSNSIEKFNKLNKKFKETIDLRYKADKIMMKEIKSLEELFK